MSYSAGQETFLTKDASRIWPCQHFKDMNKQRTSINKGRKQSTDIDKSGYQKVFYKMHQNTCNQNCVPTILRLGILNTNNTPFSLLSVVASYRVNPPADRACLGADCLRASNFLSLCLPNFWSLDLDLDAMIPLKSTSGPAK